MTIPPSESDFPPPFRFGDVTELQDFEDSIAREIDPKMTAHQLRIWQGRVALRELIRPPSFNGSITDIIMEIIPKPYERLLQVQEEGLKFVDSNGPTRGRGQRSGASLEEAMEFSQGFNFTANAKSSGVGTIGTIQSELFYVPTYDPNTKNEYGPIKRFVTRPVIDKDVYEEMNEQSKQIAFRTRQKNMMHPFIAPNRK